MNNDVLFAFVMFQVTFLLLDIYILAKTGRDITRKGEHTWFCALIVTHMVYLVCNTVWSLHEYDLVELPRTVLMAVCSLSLWSVINCATSFFLFVTEKRKLRFFQTPAGRLIRQIPAFISTVLIVLNPWTGLVFTLSPEGYFVHEVLYLPTLVLAGLYLIAVSAVGAVNAVRAQTTFQRNANAALGGSVLLIILFIVLDSLVGRVSRGAADACLGGGSALSLYRGSERLQKDQRHLRPHGGRRGAGPLQPRPEADDRPVQRLRGQVRRRRIPDDLAARQNR